MRVDFVKYVGSEVLTHSYESCHLSETLVHTRATWRYIPEDGNFVKCLTDVRIISSAMLLSVHICFQISYYIV
jgi:hypothetical protein